ncbi:ceramidase domain-containing protein [Aestuariivivens insulae]|uniref:ceramidase domain-containing protein n=1 Tax=Aestuariivivens insulae TaxID=1621988 RepID=UPI001F5615A2|nr:ceramidase domain-containing protein [Aestuariivivens insulae]
MNSKINRERIGVGILIALAIFSVIGICLVGPIQQDQLYHNFSDSFKVFNIANFWNVVSNVPFTIVGVFGLVNLNKISGNKIQYLVLFIGILLVSIGSGYYHLHPNNTTLVWDRLPMTIVFMTLVTIIISEFIKPKLGKVLLMPLILVGILSVCYWVGFSDLRPYVLIQFYPMFAMPIILISFKSSFTKSFGYWVLLIAYIIAKVCEYFDKKLFDFLSVISGHSLKHILSAIGLAVLVYTYIKRRKITLNTI